MQQQARTLRRLRSPIAPNVLSIAKTAVLLVVSDFDGTLSELVGDPADAQPSPASIATLVELAALNATHVAILSGRGREDLLRRTGAPANVIHIGSHGAEDPDIGSLDAPTQLLEDIAGRIERIAAKARGLRVERKPLAVALHFRQAAAVDADSAIDAVHRLASGVPSVSILRGHAVIELCVQRQQGSTVACSKGDAVERLRRRVQATAVLFVGDDLTDEDGFQRLGPRDLGVKVGPGDTAAAMRIAAVPEVVAFLQLIRETRRRWLLDEHNGART